MKKIGMNVYKYEELNDDIKDSLYRKYRDSFEYPWRIEAENTLDKFCEIFGIHINYMDIDYNHVEFTVDYESYEHEEGIAQMSPIRLRTYIINNFFEDIHNKKYILNRYTNNAHRYSNITYTRDCPLTGYCFDMDILDTIWDFIDNPMKYKYATYESILEECLSQYMKAYNYDYDDMISKDYFESEIIPSEDKYYTNDGIEIDMDMYEEIV